MSCQTYITVLQLNQRGLETTITDCKSGLSNWLADDSGILSIDVSPRLSLLLPLHHHLVLFGELSLAGWKSIALDALGWCLGVSGSLVGTLLGSWGSWWSDFIAGTVIGGDSVVSSTSAAVILGALNLNGLGLGLAGRLLWGWDNRVAFNIELRLLWSSGLAFSLWDWVSISIKLGLWGGSLAWGLLDWVALGIELWGCWAAFLGWGDWSCDLLVVLEEVVSMC